MKVTDKYTHMALTHTLMNVYNMKELANAVVKHLNRDGVVAEMHKTENSGFTLRKLAAANLSDNALINTIVDTISDLMDDRIDDVMDFMIENYDIQYDVSLITEEFVRDVFDFSRNGRRIYVEVDSI